MKQIGEIQPERSLTAYEDIGAIAKQPERKTPTPSDGCGTGVMIAPGTPRPRPDEVQDILWKLSTIKPWEIKPDDQKAVQNALNALAWATVPATTDEAVYWLARLIAHFPRRDTTKDAIVVADIAADLVDAGVSLLALVGVCNDIRKGATAKAPWFPPSGEILQQCVERTRGYVRSRKALEAPRNATSGKSGPKTPDPAWVGKPWDGMSDEIKGQLVEFLAPMASQVRRAYCDTLPVDYDQVAAWAEIYNNIL